MKLLEKLLKCGSSEASTTQKQSIKYYEVSSDKPKIIHKDGKYICLSLVYFSNGCVTRRDGFGSTYQEAYEDWDSKRMYMQNHGAHEEYL